MSQNKINSALLTALYEVTPAIDTVQEGHHDYTPTSDVEYQEIYIEPVGNNSEFINEKDYINYGIFQINLRYPAGIGTLDIINRAELYINKFFVGKKLIYDGQEVIIRKTPNLVNLGKDGDRIVYVVSIEYKALINVI